MTRAASQLPYNFSMNTNYLSKGVPPEWAGVSQVFTALGDPYRQRILLAFEPGEALSIQVIVGGMVLSRTAVVHHLNVLRDAGLLRREQVGRETRYQLDPVRMHEAIAAVQGYLARFLQPATDGIVELGFVPGREAAQPLTLDFGHEHHHPILPSGVPATHE